MRADKSRTIYIINPSNYHKILRNKITDTYKIDDNDTLKFANKLHIEDRLRKFNMKDAYILFKDHKPNFENKLQSRLINPSKTVRNNLKKYHSKYCS